jgi:subtilisin family serine protease
MQATALCFVAALAGTPTAPAAPTPAVDYYQYLSRDLVGADAFTRQEPTWDGRGVVIAVLDTGVDPGVPGLRTTSTGDLKVIETRDFSGQGTIELARPREETVEGVRVLRTDKGFVKGVEALPPASPAGYWLGFFDEKRLASAIPDLNLDGDANDHFAVLALVPKGTEEPVALIDTDGDGDLSDEKARKSYRVEPAWFSFPHPDPAKNQTPVSFTLAIQLDHEAKQVELHFDDGGHGTHCAGIAAGHQIQGREGFDGIAPGAQVISLKIGHGGLAGGATPAGAMKRAFAYASRWADEHRVPVVVSLSYGIGSEIEGASEIDEELARVVESNPRLAAVVSAGNNGPGLSSLGMPGTSRRAFTAGAVLTPANAEALWGARVAGPRVFAFSSRGGELSKPDGLAPGAAWSSVPPFLPHAVMAGTSMAAPQAAGVHALLISAALARKLAWSSGLLKRALRATARPLPGYTTLDQGAGVIQVGPAFDALERMAPRARPELLCDWDVTTPVPHQPGNRGTASFWRTGRYVPAAPHTVDVDVQPAFFKGATEKDKRDFFADLRLDTDAGWIKVDRRALAIRGADKQTVRLTLDPGAVDEPGLHVGRLRGSDDAGANAFVVPIAIVAPYRFETEETRSRRFAGSLLPSEITRFFVAVPPGATAMQLWLTAPPKKLGQTQLVLFDPAGRTYHDTWFAADSVTGKDVHLAVSGKELEPGVWEAVLYAGFRVHEATHYELEVGFSAVESPTELAYEVGGDGLTRAKLEVASRFDQPFRGPVKATVVGRRKRHTVEAKGPQAWFELAVPSGFSGAELVLTVAPSTWQKVTDIAVTVTDGQAATVARTAFNQRTTRLDAAVGPGIYKVKLTGGLVDPDAGKTLAWKVEVVELVRLAAPVAMSVKPPGGGGVVLYPNVETRLELETGLPLPELADGYRHALQIELWQAEARRTWAEFEVDLKR